MDEDKLRPLSERNSLMSRLLQLSRQNDSILVCRFLEHAKVYYRRYKTDRAESSYCRLYRLVDETDNQVPCNSEPLNSSSYTSEEIKGAYQAQSL